MKGTTSGRQLAGTTCPQAEDLLRAEESIGGFPVVAGNHFFGGWVGGGWTICVVRFGFT